MVTPKLIPSNLHLVVFQSLWTEIDDRALRAIDKILGISKKLSATEYLDAMYKFHRCAKQAHFY